MTFETRTVGDLFTVTDYVANGSFQALSENVTYLHKQDYAVMVRLVDHNSQWKSPLLYTNKESYIFLRKSSLESGDIVIANVGANAGTVFRAPDLGIPMTLAPNSVACFPKDEKQIDRDFAYFYFSSPYGQWSISSILGGSAQPKFNKTDFRSLEIKTPPIAEQKVIAHILGTLDDKIELNRKTNETLEAMANALFKSWFVDFDPVRAKAEGRPTGLPAEISDLFPDSFEDSELGDIPSGWEVYSLDEVIELAYGKPLKEEQRNGGSYPVFGSNGVVGSHNEYLVEAPGIVIGRKGNPGTVEWSGKNFYPIDTTFFVVKKKGDLGMRFLFYCLKNQNLSNLSADSAVPGLNRNHAYMNIQLLPPVEVASAFERHLEVIFNRKAFLAEEINTLGATRDALLPKLISGEIRIPDAEKMLEEVGV